MMKDFAIIKTHPLLIQYVDSLQRVNAEALSFYPKCVFEREAEAGRIFLGLLNGEPCGYIYAGAGGPDSTVKCHQVCIQYDARRRLYGARLVVALEDYAEENGASAVSLRCGFDLEANDFWQSLGYVCINNVAGGIRRNRTINVWRKQIRLGLFDDVAIEPAKGKADATIWRKHKSTNIVTQFNRGKSLQDYRAIVMSKKETPARDE
jgi:GNAT superfamily N-acetyltransferase